MIKVIFKNLDKSELTREAVKGRLFAIVEKFPDLRNSQILVTLEMENSPVQPGPDLFGVSVHIARGRYRDVRVEKSAPNLYVALADVVESLLEALNRFGDRSRVQERNRARKLLRSLPKVEAREEPETFDGVSQ